MSELLNIQQLLADVDDNTKELSHKIAENVDSMLNPTTIVQGTGRGALIGLWSPSAIPFAIGASCAPTSGNIGDGIMQSLMGTMVALPFLFITLPVGLCLTPPAAAVGASVGAVSQLKSAIFSKPAVTKNLKTIYATVLTAYNRLNMDESAIHMKTDDESGDILYDELNKRLDEQLKNTSPKTPSFDINTALPYSLNPELTNIINKIACSYKFKTLTTDKIINAFKFFTKKNSGWTLKERFSVIATLYYFTKHYDSYTPNIDDVFNELF